MISDFQREFSSLANQYMQDEVVASHRQRIETILQKPIASVQEALNALREIRMGLPDSQAAHPFIKNVKILARAEWERLRAIEEAREEALPSTSAVSQKRELEEIQEALPSKKKKEDEYLYLTTVVLAAEAEPLGELATIPLLEIREEEISRCYERAKVDLEEDIKGELGDRSPNPTLQAKINAAKQEAFLKIEEDKSRAIHLVKMLQEELREDPVLRSVCEKALSFFVDFPAMAAKVALEEKLENLIALILCLKGKNVSDEYLRESGSVSVTLWRKHMLHEWKNIHDGYTHLQTMSLPCAKVAVGMILGRGLGYTWSPTIYERILSDELKEEQERTLISKVVDPFINPLMEELDGLIQKIPPIVRTGRFQDEIILDIGKEFEELIQEYQREGITCSCCSYRFILAFQSIQGMVVQKYKVREIVKSIRQMKKNGLDLKTIDYMLSIADANFRPTLISGNAYEVVRSLSRDQVRLFVDVKKLHIPDSSVVDLFALIMGGAPWNLIEKLASYPPFLYTSFCEKDIQNLLMEMKEDEINLYFRYFGENAGYNEKLDKKILASREKISEFFDRVAAPISQELSENQRLYCAARFFEAIYGGSKFRLSTTIHHTFGVFERLLTDYLRYSMDLHAIMRLGLLASRLTLEERSRLIDACGKNDPFFYAFAESLDVFDYLAAKMPLDLIPVKNLVKFLLKMDFNNASTWLDQEIETDSGRKTRLQTLTGDKRKEFISHLWRLNDKLLLENWMKKLNVTREEVGAIVGSEIFSGNTLLGQLYLQYYDLLKNNRLGQAPLAEQFMRQGKEWLFPPTLPTPLPSVADVEIFLRELLKIEGVGEVPGGQFNDKVVFATKFGPIEVQGNRIEAFLLSQKTPSLLPRDITRENFFSIIDYMKKKYPMVKVDDFITSPFSINREHLKTGCILEPIPPDVSHNYPLEGLYQLFDAMPWGDAMLAKLYGEALELGPNASVPPNAKEELRNKLREYIEKIQKRVAYLGTPQPGPALDDFYGKIELCLRHCGAKLSEKPDEFAAQDFLKEIISSSLHCGGRIFQTAVNQYYGICCGIKESPRDFFLRLLADYRRICFEGVVNDIYSGNVHALTGAMKALGVELGIPGAGDVFEDVFALDRDLDKEEIRGKFFHSAYTPHAIVFDHLIPTLNTDAKARDVYIDLQQEIMPPTWNDEKYANVYKELDTIPQDVANRGEAENAILAKYEVDKIKKEQPAAEAIEADRKMDYLSSFVHDQNGKRTIKGIFLLLEQMGVLNFKLPLEEQVPPSLLKRIGGAIGRIFNW